MEVLAGIAVGLAALVTAAVALYRAQPDKESTVVSTATEMAERLVNTAGTLVRPLEERVAALDRQVAVLLAAAERDAAGIGVLKDKVEECERSRIELLASGERCAAEIEQLKAQVGGRREADPENGGNKT